MIIKFIKRLFNTKPYLVSCVIGGFTFYTTSNTAKHFKLEYKRMPKTTTSKSHYTFGANIGDSWHVFSTPDEWFTEDYGLALYKLSKVEAVFLLNNNEVIVQIWGKYYLKSRVIKGYVIAPPEMQHGDLHYSTLLDYVNGRVTHKAIDLSGHVIIYQCTLNGKLISIKHE